jgi:hypothetical protein
MRLKWARFYFRWEITFSLSDQVNITRHAPDPTIRTWLRDTNNIVNIKDISQFEMTLTTRIVQIVNKKLKPEASFLVSQGR